MTQTTGGQTLARDRGNPPNALLVAHFALNGAFGGVGGRWEEKHDTAAEIKAWGVSSGGAPGGGVSASDLYIVPPRGSG